MCIQVCSQQSLLIDNDLSCAGCVLSIPERLPDDWTCATCVHHVPRSERGICGLTQERVPVVERCCHWNAPTPPADAGSRFPLAPWLDANEYAIGSYPALAIPLVYGVPSWSWDEALDGLADEPETDGLDYDGPDGPLTTALVQLLRHIHEERDVVEPYWRVVVHIRDASSCHTSETCLLWESAVQMMQESHASLLQNDAMGKHRW